MTTIRIDQAVPAFSRGDAIGNDALALRAMLRRRGVVSEIFAGAVHHSLQREARPWSEYAAVDAPGNVCLLHFSIGTPLAGDFARLRSRRVLVYHNITPPEFARGISPRVERDCRAGREQLRWLAGQTELGIGDSAYNRQELDELGFARTAVLPIVVDFAEHDRQPLSPALAALWRDGRTNILHVGRFAPNKRIEDLVRAFDLYRRVDRHSRLLLVGTAIDFENYAAGVRALAARLGTPDVHFIGRVGFEDLCAFYRLADLYLVMSEHEGFCVPLLEAMHFGVPIVAYAAGAVPETLGAAGMLVREKRFEEIAELMRIAVSEREVRERLVAAGHARLADFAPAKIERDLCELLARHGLAAI